MVDRPIIFSGAMIRALIEGRKSQTRRLAWKPQGPMTSFSPPPLDPSPWQRVQPGDRLWVRENWRADARCDDERPLSIGAVEYDASERQFPEMPAGKLRPSIHMPRWASRLTLTVTAVKVERLQEISEQDAEAEGVRSSGPLPWHEDDVGAPPHMGAVENFAALWNHIHGADAWDANPAVVVIGFQCALQNIDQITQANRRAADRRTTHA